MNFESTDLGKSKRIDRYIDSCTNDVLKSQNLNNLKTFYNGDKVNERMGAVRKWIVHIRQNWSDYPEFMEVR